MSHPSRRSRAPRAKIVIVSLLWLGITGSAHADEPVSLDSPVPVRDYNNQVPNLRLNNFAVPAADEDLPRIPVDYNTSTHNNNTFGNDTDHNDSTPVIPVPGGGNHSHHQNHSHHHHTFAPTLAPTNSSSSNDTTIAPTMTPTNSSDHNRTDAPNHTPHPTPTPAPTKAYPTPAPTPADDNTHSGGSTWSHLGRMLGKLVAWCLLMVLAVLGYGWAMNHRYQIAYYCRHLGHCLVSCHRMLVAKLRARGWWGGGGGGGDYMAVDSQAMNTLIFDSPHTNPFDDDHANNYSTD